jgi:hypothetical protein
MSNEIKYGGTEYKYNEICELLGDEPLQGGKYRQVQLNKWNREYKVEKVGTKYIYHGELTAAERELLETDGKFTTYIQNLLVALLKRKQLEGSNEIRIGHRELREYLAMVNTQYYKVQRDKNQNRVRFLTELAEDKNLSEVGLYENLDLFYEQSNKELKEIIKRSLESMEKRRILLYSKAFRFYRRIYYDPDNRAKYCIESHECDEDEMMGVLAIYREVFEEFGIESTQQIFSLGDSSKFYDRVNSLVSLKYGYDICYETFRIWLDPTVKLTPLSGLEDKNKLKLNENIQEKLKRMSEHKRFLDKSIPAEHINEFVESLISISNNDLE